MSCYHPLVAWKRPDSHTGKNEIVFERFCASKDDVASSRKLEMWSQGYELTYIPCGQCIGCRLDYSKSWAVRCVLEAKQWDHNFFVTLTYDDEHLPVAFNRETGELYDEPFFHPLHPDDLKAFMKALRQEYSLKYGHDNIRFFACGEYGDRSFRPHYHLILFNLPIPDLQVYKQNFDGSLLYNSPTLSKVWHRGHVVIAEVNYQTCAYVARYVMKKSGGRDKDFYYNNDLEPEFVRMSRKPGIARSYYDTNSHKIYNYDEIIIADGKGHPLKVKPPKYFDKLFDIDDPEFFLAVKENRVNVAKLNEFARRKKTSLSDKEYLAVKEGNLLAKVGKLTRSI